MRPTARSYVWRTLAATAALVTLPATGGLPVTAPVTVAAAAESTALPSDLSLQNRLHADADDARRAAGREALFERGAYMVVASRVTSALVNGTAVPTPGDDAPLAYLSGTSSRDFYASQIGGAIDAVLDSAHAVLAYPLHTDGGWNVRSVTLSDGRIRWAVAFVVGWPDPAVGTNTGCVTSSGYCWSTRGLNPHLPWTRNTVTWYLSTANLPSAGETLVRNAIANLNRVNNFGADLVYGGRTNDTSPTTAHRFLIVWGSGCSSSTALACTATGTQGTYHLVYQARTVITRSRYLANPNSTWWTGTLMHEIAHATGLGHFDGTYGGRYQLMRWANGPNSIMPGDVNGLRRLAPYGRVTASIRTARSSVGSYSLVVRTANSGLGGIRSIVTQCTDAFGTWHDVASTSGRFDTRTADRTVGSVFAFVGITRYCRAVVKSKTMTVTTATVAV